MMFLDNIVMRVKNLNDTHFQTEKYIKTCKYT